MPGDYDLGTARGRIDIDASGAEVASAKAGAAADSMKEKHSQAADSMVKGGAIMVGSAAVVAAGFVVAVNAAADFESGMSAIQAVSGATAPQMDQIRQKALQLGADTKYSAGEASSAMEELIKAGLSVDDVLNGAADATVNLAAAGEVSLPEAATIASNAMNQFGLSAKEMPHVADLIAGAANASAIDVSEFGQSMSQAGAVAHLVGFSFDDLSVAIAAMGNAGIKGGDAGTSLKTMMMNLQPTTAKASEAFHQLGLETYDAQKAQDLFNKMGIQATTENMDDAVAALSYYIEKMGGAKQGTEDNYKATMGMLNANGAVTNSFFDASGKVKSMSEVAGILHDKLGGLTEQQKTMALQTLFGTDAIRAAAVMTEQGAQGFDNLAQSMGKVSAADVAKTRMDNFAGSLEQLKGSLETMLIIIGTPLLHALRGIVDHVTEVVNWFSTLDQGTLELIMKIVGIGAAVLGFLGTLLLVVGLVQKFTAAMQLLNAAILMNPVVLIIAALVALGVALVIAYQKVGWFHDAVDQIAEIANEVADALGGWQNVLIGIGAAMLLIVSPIAAVVAGFIYLYTQVDAFRTAVDAVVASLILAYQWFNDNIYPTLFSIGELFAAVAQRLIDAWTMAWPFIQLALNLIIGGIQNFVATVMALWDLFGSDILAAVQLVWNNISGIIEAAMAVIHGIIDTVTALIKGDWSGAWDGIKEIFQGVWDYMKQLVETTIAAIKLVIQTTVDAITGLWKVAWDGVKAEIDLVWTGIKGFITDTINLIKDTISDKVNAIKDLWSTVWGAIKDKVTDIWNAIKDFVTGKIGEIRDFIADTIGSIRDTWAEVWDAVSKKASDIWEGIKATIRGALDTLLGWVGSLPGQMASAAAGMWDWLSDGFRAAADAAIGLMNGLIDLVNSFQIHIHIVMPSEIPNIDFDWNGLHIPHIPLLDVGGLVTNPTLAMLAGNRKPEIVSPVATLEEMFNKYSSPGISVKFEFNGVSREDIPAIKQAVTSNEVLDVLVSAAKAGRK